MQTSAYDARRLFGLLTGLLLGVAPSLCPAAAPLFPGTHWAEKNPADAHLDPSLLQEAAQLAGGRGCVVRHGQMAFHWGDHTRSADVASASKIFYSHLLFQAVAEGKLDSLDAPVWKFQPCLKDLNPSLQYKDRKMTFRHLAFQTACLGFTEDPGTAFDYNDATMGFFWDTLVNQVYGIPWAEADEQLFHPKLAKVLQFEDPFTVEQGHAGRPRISPRDFARVGLLYLHKGKWKDQQIIPERFAVMAVTDPLPLSIPRTQEKPAEKCATRSIGGGANQCDHNGGYSWLWWINGVARDGERWWKDAPPDMFCALGHCGQRGFAVLPTQELIVSWNDTKELHCDRSLGNRFFGLLRQAARNTPQPQPSSLSGNRLLYTPPALVP